MTRYFVGTSGWHYDDWRSRFYPDKLPRAKWLEFYSRHFTTVELNNTFYRLPSEAAFTNWYESSPPGFVFAVKVSRFITHVKRLRDCEEAVRTFAERAGLLGEKLGPLLYQLPPGVHRNDGVLESFLSGLPAGFRHVFEFRHESWHEPAVFRILRKHSAGVCVSDSPSFRTPLVATADFAYVRFHGSTSLYSSRYADDELADWAEKLAGLASKLKAMYIYFNNDVQGFAIDNAVTIRNFLKRK